MITKAEKFLNSLGIVEDVSDGELVNKAQVAAGQAPEIFASLSGDTRELYFHFDDESILNVDLIEPGRRQVSVLIRRKE
jgi:hypothetical protein